MRLFVAVDAPAEIRNRLVLLQEEMNALGAKARYVEPANLHLTLKFIGEAEPEGIISALNGLKAEAFQVEVRGVGRFPGIVWVGLEPREQLQALVGQIERLLKVPKENRPFSPHLTIARLRFGNLGEFVKKHEEDFFGRWTVEEVKLKQSILTPKGPIYNDLWVGKI